MLDFRDKKAIQDPSGTEVRNPGHSGMGGNYVVV